MEFKEKVIIYPFDIESCSILRHQNFLENKEIVGLVAPIGWGMNEQDAGKIDGGKMLNISVKRDFDTMLDCCETVFFTNSYNKIDFNKIIYPKMIKSIEEGKNIICTIPISNEVLTKLCEMCKESGVRFDYYGETADLIDVKETLAISGEELLRIDTSIVYVMGIGERTDKFEIELSLVERLRTAGYNVSLVSSRAGSELLGVYSFPKFMFNSSISESSKVIAFNRYIKHIEKQDNSDLIVIGIPGGIMPLSDTFTKGFGITAYEVSNAAAPDFSIISLLYEEFTKEYFDTIANAVRYKFGFNVDCFNISTSRLDWTVSRLEKMIQYTTLNHNFVDKKKMEFGGIGVPVCNVFNEKDNQFMAENIIDKLSEYANIN